MPTPADAIPLPPRFWWLKRLTFLGVLFFAALFGLRWWAIVRADARLASLLAKHRAAGEPVDLADFLPPSLSKEENAAEEYVAAAAVLGTLTSGTFPARVAPHCEACRSLYVISFLRDMDLVQSRPSCAAAVLVMLSEATGHIDAGLQRPRADWLPGPLRNPSNLSLGSAWTCQPAMGLIRLRAQVAHELNDDRQAVQAYHDLLTINEQAAAPPISLDTLFHVDYSHFVFQAILDTASELETQDGQNVGSGNGAARAALESLIARLSSTNELQSRLLQALMFERMALLFDFETANPGLANATPGSPSTAASWAVEFVRRPFHSVQVFAELDYVNRLIEAVRRLDYSSTQMHIPSALPRGSASLHSAVRVVTAAFQNIARQRVAATFLAIRLYEHDFHRLPAALKDLVPAYLPVIPLDPMNTREALGFCSLPDSVLVFVPSMAGSLTLRCDEITPNMIWPRGMVYRYERCTSIGQSNSEEEP